MDIIKLLAKYKKIGSKINYDDYMEGGTEFVKRFDEYYVKANEVKKHLLDTGIIRGILIGLQMQNKP